MIIVIEMVKNGIKARIRILVLIDKRIRDRDLERKKR